MQQTAPALTAANSEIDPHAFVAIDGLKWEACAVCGTKLSFYREKWFHGMTELRRLCKRCYGAAVEREQAKIAPLPGTVDLSTMTRVTASVGRCGLCGLEAAAWSGNAGRLCEVCYQREVRRAVELGTDVMTPTSGSEAADVRP